MSKTLYPSSTAWWSRGVVQALAKARTLSKWLQDFVGLEFYEHGRQRLYTVWLSFSRRGSVGTKRSLGGKTQHCSTPKYVETSAKLCKIIVGWPTGNSSNTLKSSSRFCSLMFSCTKNVSVPPLRTCFFGFRLSPKQGIEDGHDGWVFFLSIVPDTFMHNFQSFDLGIRRYFLSSRFVSSRNFWYFGMRRYK